MRNNEHETALIQTFFLQGRQERALIQLGSKKKRSQFLNRCAHFDFDYLDKMYAELISDNKKTVEFIFTKLKSKGAPKKCYLISESKELDCKEMFLFEALQKVVGTGIGTIISSIPGKLGYYESGDINKGYILIHN